MTRWGSPIPLDPLRPRFDQLYDKFWERVDRSDPDGCWTWIGKRNHSGYGTLSAFGEQWIASRLSLYLETGEQPAGRYACHKCDNPPCVRPDHLYWGTPAQNVQDAIDRGRTNPKQIPVWKRVFMLGLSDKNLAYCKELCERDELSRTRLFNQILNLMREAEVTSWLKVKDTYYEHRRREKELKDIREREERAANESR